jgi:hypothetical protein
MRLYIIVVNDWLFRQWYVFVVMELKMRRIVHTGITKYPTDEWTAQQSREATPWGRGPKYLIRDRDKKYAMRFAAVALGSGIKRGEDAVSNTPSEWDLRKVYGQSSKGMSGSYLHS